MKREILCIVCPRGCRMTVERVEGTGKKWRVTGNRCPRGAAHAEQEMTDPRRTVTAVVRTDSPDLPYLPVRTDAPFPRAGIPALLNRLSTMTVRTPVHCGDTLLENIDNTGIRVIVTASCP